MTRAKPFSEEFLRRIVKENRVEDTTHVVQWWENLPEKKQKKMLKCKWLPKGVQPIVVGNYTWSTDGFVLCTDSVIYGHKMDFPGDKVSLVGLVGFDGNYVLTYDDGREVKLPRMYLGAGWLKAIFLAAARANAGPHREMTYLKEEYSPRLAKENSIRRFPEFWLPEEMPPYLRAKLHRAFPELPMEDVLGYCDLPHNREHCIVLTRDGILKRADYGVTDVRFDKLSSLFYCNPEKNLIQFMKYKFAENKEEKSCDDGIWVEEHLLRSVEEAVDDQYSNCWWENCRVTLRTELVTYNKAVFVHNVRRRLMDYDLNHDLCQDEDNPVMLSVRASMALDREDYEEALFYYELLRRRPRDVDYLNLWSCAGFMCCFYQPLSVTSVRWMLYYLMHFEQHKLFTMHMFLERWQVYLHNNWETSLIDQRNELARRFNAAAKQKGMDEKVPVLDGYVLDYCLKKMGK